MNDQLDLLLIYEERIPDETFVPLIAEIKRSGASFSTEKIPPSGPYAGVEWYLPTAAILFVASSYFGGVFQEMGKEHYHFLKSGIKTLKSKFFGDSPENHFYAVGSNGKVAQGKVFSLGFSIYAKTKSGQTLKFLFFDRASEGLLEKTINCYVETLSDYYAPGDDDYLSLQLKFFTKIPHTVLVYYNPKTLRPEIIDHTSVIQTP